MPEPHELTRPVMRRAAGLDADQTRRELREERQPLRSSQRLANRHFAGGINSVTWKMLLARSRPIVLICMWALLSGRFDSNHTVALRCRSHPPHLQ